MQITQESIKDVKSEFGFLGNSPGLTDAVVKAMQVAPYDISVLVTGESGTGKETIPKIIHSLGPRKHGQYVAINCGAIPEGTIDSELFGHVKGAFTDAVSDHQGYFEVANNGTVFLDEVAEMPLATQARLLRVLETGEFLRVGSSDVRRTNVRIIAATNKDLLKAAREGKFREDLYYRLSGVLITLPALRERDVQDFEMLVRHFARKFADANRSPVVRFEKDVYSFLASYKWPGNVRQLKNIIDQIALFHAGTTVNAAVVAQYIPRDSSASGDSSLTVTTGSAPVHNLEQTVAVLYTALNGLIEKVNRLEGMMDGHAGTTSPYVGTTVESLKRDTVVNEYNDQEFGVTQEMRIEHVEEPVRQSKFTHLEVEDVAQVKSLDETERETILDALKRNNGLRKRTAEELQISERTLYRKLKQYSKKDK